MGKFNPFSKDDWDKEVGKPVRDAFTGTGKQIQKPFEDAAHSLIDLGNSIKNDLENVRKQAWKSLEDKQKAAWGALGQKAYTSIHGVIDQTNKEIAKIGPAVKTELDKLSDAAEQAVKDALQEVAKKGLQEVAQKGLEAVNTTKKELNKLRTNKPELVDSIDSLGFDLEVGPISLSYSNFYNRAEILSDALEIQSKNPTKFRRKPLLEFIESVGPDSVDLGISISLAALVVSSKELGVGLKFKEIQLKLFLELGDIILEKLGIPE